MDRSSQENKLEHHRTPHRLDANRIFLGARSSLRK
jgi:hypothetical protein